jgi:hypothetical protein
VPSLGCVHVYVSWERGRGRGRERKRERARESERCACVRTRARTCVHFCVLKFSVGTFVRVDILRVGILAYAHSCVRMFLREHIRACV